MTNGGERIIHHHVANIVSDPCAEIWSTVRVQLQERTHIRSGIHTPPQAIEGLAGILAWIKWAAERIVGRSQVCSWVKDRPPHLPPHSQSGFLGSHINVPAGFEMWLKPLPGGGSTPPPHHWPRGIHSTNPLGRLVMSGMVDQR